MNEQGHHYTIPGLQAEHAIRVVELANQINAGRDRLGAEIVDRMLEDDIDTAHLELDDPSLADLLWLQIASNEIDELTVGTRGLVITSSREETVEEDPPLSATRVVDPSGRVVPLGQMRRTD